MIGAQTTTSFTFVKYSLIHGNSIPFMESGKAILQEDLIMSTLTEMRRKKILMFTVIQMIGGLTTLSTLFQFQRGLKLLSL